jgi:hypothetical protein
MRHVGHDQLIAQQLELSHEHQRTRQVKLVR